MVYALLSIDAAISAAGGLGLGHCDWIAGVLLLRRGALSEACAGVRQRIDPTTGDHVFHGRPHQAAVPADSDYFGGDGYWVVRRAVYLCCACDWSNCWEGCVAGVYRLEDWQSLKHGSAASSAGGIVVRRDHRHASLFGPIRWDVDVGHGWHL